MDPRFRTALWALAGLALAVAISLTAFAVAGGSISEPAGSVRVIPTADEQQEQTPKPSRTAEPSNPDVAPEDTGTSTPASTSSGSEPSQNDDHGGSGGSGTQDGSDD